MNTAILIFILVIYAVVLYCFYQLARRELTASMQRKFTAQTRKLKRLNRLIEKLAERVEFLEKHGFMETTNKNNKSISTNPRERMEDRYTEKLKTTIEVNGQPVQPTRQ